MNKTQMKKELARLKKELHRKNLVRRTRPPNPYRSWYEVGVAKALLEAGIPYGYEEGHLLFIVPPQPRKYKPDFIITTKSGNEIVVESKGRFTSADRKKMAYVIEQNPDRDVRMLFQSDNRLTKAKRSQRYTEWCAARNIKCAVGNSIPEEWINE